MKLDSCLLDPGSVFVFFLVLLKKCYGVTVSRSKIMQTLHGLCSFRLAIQVLKVYLGSPTENRGYNRGGGWGHSQYEQCEQIPITNHIPT